MTIFPSSVADKTAFIVLCFNKSREGFATIFPSIIHIRVAATYKSDFILSSKKLTFNRCIGLIWKMWNFMHFWGFFIYFFLYLTEEVRRWDNYQSCARSRVIFFFFIWLSRTFWFMVLSILVVSRKSLSRKSILSFSGNIQLLEGVRFYTCGSDSLKPKSFQIKKRNRLA